MFFIIMLFYIILNIIFHNFLFNPNYVQTMSAFAQVGTIVTLLEGGLIGQHTPVQSQCMLLPIQRFFFKLPAVLTLACIKLTTTSSSVTSPSRQQPPTCYSF